MMDTADTVSDDLDLLERSADYALSAVETVRPDLLCRPTPCSKWDLRMLLEHAIESLAALHEGLENGRVGLFPSAADDVAADPVSTFQAHVIGLLGEWTPGRATRCVSVADRVIPLSVAAGAAAVEITVHGWDIAQATGHHRPIPSSLSLDLLAISAVLLSDGNRHQLFAPPVRPPLLADPSDKLVAFLGRRATVTPEPAPTRRDTPTP